MTMRLPNGGVIWYRSGPNSAFCKHNASIDGATLTLQPTSNTLFRRKLAFDLKLYFIQVIPAARVTGIRGRSSSPSNAALRKDPSASMDSPRVAKTDDERYHTAEAYLSLCLRAGGAEGMEQRVVLRTRDLTETMLWQGVLLQASGRPTQAIGETYPWGNPVEDARLKAEQATREKEMKDAQVPDTETAATTVENDAGSEHTTNSSPESSSSDEEGKPTHHRKGKRSSATPHRKRAASNSVAFEDIPLVKATSTVSKQKPRHHADNDEFLQVPGFFLTVQDASSDETASPEKLRRGSKKRATKVFTEEGKLRWRFPQEGSCGATPNSATVAFLQTLWTKAHVNGDELLFRSVARPILESDFAMAAISQTSRRAADNGAHLFDQGDQRTFASCKSAMQRNGVPIAVVSVSSNEERARLLRDEKVPQLAIARFDTASLRVLLPAEKVLVIPYGGIKSLLSEDTLDRGAQEGSERGSSVTPTTNEESLSAKSSGQRGFSSSARLLRRLSPTPSSTSLSVEGKTLDLNSPMSEYLDNSSLALVIPSEETLVMPKFQYLLHVYYLPNAREMSSCELYRRAPIHAVTQVVTIGFEVALERKAALATIVEKQKEHAKLAIREVSGPAGDNTPTPIDKSVEGSPLGFSAFKLDFSDYLMMSPSHQTMQTTEEAPRPSTVNLGAFQNHSVNPHKTDQVSRWAAMMQYAISNDIAASSDIDVGHDRYQRCVQPTINDLVMDSLQNQMVQYYMESARRTY